MMVAEHIAVVAEEDDERILRPAAAAESVEDPADLFINERDRAVVTLPRPPHLLGAEIAVPRVALRSAGARERLRPGRGYGLRDVGSLAPKAVIDWLCGRAKETFRKNGSGR